MILKTAPVDARPQLSRSAVIDRAFTIADAEGLAAVTIRRLAQELGVTPMALYWHFKNKDELFDAIGDDVIGRIELSADTAARWDERLRVIVTNLVTVLRAHPSLANLAATRIVASEHGLELTEQTLSLLRSAGFSVAEAANLAHQALHTAIMLCSAEPGLELGVVDTDAALAAKRARLASLPADRYPHVIEASDDLIDCDDEEFYYSAGIDLFIAGVRGMHQLRVSGD
ncbi:TetR family transcriptional regulator [Jatrophihabitans sp. GAS493]|uniref:TetR family transcriptional regulator n=1 Tax=Jatrophihabitans sp. GAS493 TaxID=1907575 RepID=UPI000BC055CF|nr:TetR family transcriptional regulator [Jatrophihabitans sp. GAS493]SOD71094.1 TetR family transcriptional regulator [Jatrophihabitans sp. GAS493]